MWNRNSQQYHHSNSIIFYDASSKVYDDQLKNGIQLSVRINPNNLNCINNHPFRDPVPARPAKGVIIYTESDVIYLPDHQGI